jgi:hypothetical protein
MEISTVAPSPVRPLRSSAVSTPVKAYMPAAMSATEMPTLAGSWADPVTETRPASHCTSRS